MNPAWRTARRTIRLAPLAYDASMQLVDLPITYGRIADLPADPLIQLRAQYAAHGEISAFQDGNQRFVCAFGPNYNRQILGDPETFHSCFFATRGPRNSAQRRLSSGLLSMNGVEHRRHRRLVIEPFKLHSFAAYVEPISQLIREMLAEWTPGQTRDIQEDMTQFLLKVTSSMLFGFDQPETTTRIGRMIHEWVELCHRMGTAVFGLVPAGYEDYERLLSLAEELEGEISELLRMRRSSPRDGNDVLSILVRLHDQEGALGESELIGHAALLFAAAHLTTSHSLTWTLLLLCQHPQVMQELVTEIDSVVGSAPLQLADQPRLQVLDRVVKESMRVLPASAYVQRINVVPTQLGPFSLVPGTIVVFSQFVTHHMRELFDEPDRFLPDRWLEITPSPYAYLPFGAGPRMCIGGPLALVIMKLTIPAILQRFRLHVPAGAEINAAVISTMLTPTTPVPMEVHPRGEIPNAAPISGNIHELVALPAV